MNDIDIIKKLSTEFNIILNKVSAYSWEEVGYVVNNYGRVESLNLHAQEIKKLPEFIRTCLNLNQEILAKMIAQKAS